MKIRWWPLLSITIALLSTSCASPTTTSNGVTGDSDTAVDLSGSGADNVDELVRRVRTATSSGDLGELAQLMRPQDRCTLALMGAISAREASMLFAAMRGEGDSELAERFREAKDDPSVRADIFQQMTGGDERRRKEFENLLATSKTAGSPAEIDAIFVRYGVDLTQLQRLDPTAPDGFQRVAQAIMADVEIPSLLGELSAEIPQPTASSIGDDADWEEPVVEGDRGTVAVAGERLQFFREGGRWFVSPTLAGGIPIGN